MRRTEREGEFLPETADEEIESLKGIIGEQTKAYGRLEEMYYTDTNDLKRENEKLKQVQKKLDTENSGLRVKIEYLSKFLEDNEKINSEKFKETEEKLEELQTILKEKESELYHITDLLRKNQNDRKGRDEKLKDLHKQLSTEWEAKKIIEDNLNIYKRDLKIARDTLLLEKDKNRLLEQQVAEYSSLREKFDFLEESLIATKKSEEFTAANYLELKNKYLTLKDKFEENQEKLRDTLEKINDPSTPINAPKQQLKRTSTFSSVSSLNESQQKESFTRLQSKTIKLEEELLNEKIEKEKIMKNFEYCKKQVNEKVEVIEKLEKRLKVDVEEEVRKGREEVIEKIKEFCGKLEGILRGLSEELKCGNCRMECSVARFNLGCQHVYCKPCSLFQEICPCCFENSKITKMKILKKFSANVLKLKEIVPDLLLIIR